MPKPRVKRHKNEDLHAVMGVDPGGTSGVAGCYVRLGETMRETMAEGVSRAKAVEVEGDWLSQSQAIANMMVRFMFTANVENEIPLDNIHFAFEDFVLRRKTEGGATGNLTSCWVAAGAVAIYDTQHVIDAREKPQLFLMGRDEPSPVTWRQASQAKSYATNERLKIWGLWEVGSDHKRDAWRHVASEINLLIG